MTQSLLAQFVSQRGEQHYENVAKGLFAISCAEWNQSIERPNVVETEDTAETPRTQCKFGSRPGEFSLNKLDVYMPPEKDVFHRMKPI